MQYARLATALAAVASFASLAPATAPALGAQQPRPGTPALNATRSADERAVLALEDAWASAAVKRDAATFRRLLAPGFIYTEDARTQTGDELIRDIVSGTDTLREARNEELATRSFGNTMIVTGWLVMRGRGKGVPFERRYRFTDTWLKRDGQWQIIAAQDYLLPAGRR